MPLNQVKQIIVVLSGKGGVGKSSVTTQLALTLSGPSYRLNVGVLDLDLTGPNVPRFFGVEAKTVIMVAGGAIKAVTVYDKLENKRGALSAMSLGFILASRSSSVVWRGPKKKAMVRQFLTETLWPTNLDILLIDTPPGTSDEHISLMQVLHEGTRTAATTATTATTMTTLLPTLAGGVMVTTPQAVATADVRKQLFFCTKVALPLLGIVENMSGFVCPHCRECSNVFSRGGGAVMAHENGVPFLGQVPIDLSFGQLIEGGVIAQAEGSDASEEETEKEHVENEEMTLVDKYQKCPLSAVFENIVDKLMIVMEGGTIH